VADLLVTLIGETLGYSGTTIRFVDGNQLAPSRVPAMVRRYMPPRPAYDLEGDTPAAAAYRANETRVFDDLSAERPSLDRGEIRATAYVPMGSHGLISVGSLEVGGISSFDRRLIEVLAGHATLVLDRLDYEDTLRRAKEEAEEANRTKSVLLANINHEFRTPLTSIISASRLLEDNPSLAGSLATRISSGGKRLLYTLNTVMDFAELEGDQTSFSRQRFDVRDVVTSTADDFREAAAQNGVSITTEQPDHPLVVLLDPHYVARICTHLMSNAIKFSEEDGAPIVIGARADGGAAVLWVEDDGIGIDPSFQPHVYDEFAQASSGYDRTHDGNGLGLTITKRLVDRMGGSLDLDSTPGEGTRVTVRLPRNRDETPLE
jgi:signal transduction histidine kinase